MNTETASVVVNESQPLTPEQIKIVQALSSEEYYWRSAERLSAVTGLQGETLGAALAQLLRAGIVKPSFSKKHNLIFGLRERVEKK